MTTDMSLYDELAMLVGRIDTAHPIDQALLICGQGFGEEDAGNTTEKASPTPTTSNADGTGAQPVLAWSTLTPQQAMQAEFVQRYDLVVLDMSEHILPDPIITKMRDMWGKKVVALTKPDDVRLRSFGFSHFDVSSLLTASTNSDSEYATVMRTLQTSKVWQFNILEYKPAPDWLNAKFWANPELFDRYRW